MLDKACKAAELLDDDGKPITTLHGLRATGATMARNAGFSPFVIQHQMGHSDLRVTHESYLDGPDVEVLGGHADAFTRL